MPKIQLNGVSKRFGYQWIVSQLTYTFDSDIISGISGHNGSGKSTIIKMLSGYLSPSEGNISYQIEDRMLSRSKLFSFVSLAAPYTDVVQEFTLKEMFEFHSAFKPMSSFGNFKEFQAILEMAPTDHKPIQHFSSGMKQKIQLAFALYSDTPFLLLDEPTSFLDTKAKQWFTHHLNLRSTNRCIVLASNDQYDLGLCHQILAL
jgi:ABC-type multidrug transport system ATPase subunit